jgi:hypothetical protein
MARPATAFAFVPRNQFPDGKKHFQDLEWLAGKLANAHFHSSGMQSASMHRIG